MGGLSFVAKPNTYFDGQGRVFSPVLIRNETDFERFCREYPPEAFYCQKFIEGSSVYLLYYILEPKNAQKIGGGKQVFKFSQRNLMQQAGGKSILAAEAAQYHLQPLSRPFEELLLSLGYHGFVMIEVRLCGGKAYMIEANPRFWGPSQLFVDAGANFFELFLREYGFLDGPLSPFSENRKTLYFWHGGTVPEKNQIPVFFDGFGSEYPQRVLSFLEQDVYRREDTAALFTEYL